MTMIDAIEELFRDSRVHRLEKRVWPPRYVVCNTSVGWNECEQCGREHRIWMVSSAVWRLVPKSMRRKRICVQCFRASIWQSWTQGMREQALAIHLGLA